MVYHCNHALFRYGGSVLICLPAPGVTKPKQSRVIGGSRYHYWKARQRHPNQAVNTNVTPSPDQRRNGQGWPGASVGFSRVCVNAVVRGMGTKGQRVNCRCNLGRQRALNKGGGVGGNQAKTRKARP